MLNLTDKLENICNLMLENFVFQILCNRNYLEWPKLYASAIGLRYTFGVRLNVGCEKKKNTLGLGFIEHPLLL